MTPDPLELLKQVARTATSAEQREALLDELAQKIPEGFLEEQHKFVLATKAREDKPDGFFAFYELIHGIHMPDHLRLETQDAFKAHAKGVPYTLIGWRGSWKTVTFGVTFQAWRIGLEPRKTNVTISANDDSAEKITKSVAMMIENNPEWKRVFPHVIPNTGRWSVEGFWVIDDSYTAEQWAEAQAGVIDPTFVGGGRESTRVNGKHPTGVLYVDDVHDINNSSSDRERRAVVRAMTAVVLKTAVVVNDKLSTWVLNVGVPWAQDDTHNALKVAGAVYREVPAMRRASEGDEGAIYIDGKNQNTGVTYDDIKGWWILTEPARYGVNSIIRERSMGKAEFWQMIMMDIATAKSGGIRFYGIEPIEVDKTWPARGGVDPAFTMRDRSQNLTRNSSFALAYLVNLPRGGGVIEDGVLDKCPPQGAANHILAASTLFPNWRFAAVENSQMGLLFIQTLRLINPNISILPSDLRAYTPRGERAARPRSKHDRILYELAPWLENGTIKISKKQTPFLDALRDGLENFNELDDNVADDRLDALDAVYHAVKSSPELLPSQNVGETIGEQAAMEYKQSPIYGIASYRGY